MGWPGPMTHRQFTAWQEWLREELNHPDRTDHYLMMIAAEVRRANVKDPRRITLDDFRLTFRSKAEREEIDREKAASMAKAAWASRIPKGAFVKGPGNGGKPS